jgi:hypothetical protein
VISGEYCVFHNEIADSSGLLIPLPRALCIVACVFEFSPGLPYP